MKPESILKKIAALSLCSLFAIFALRCQKEAPIPAKVIAGEWATPGAVFFLSQTDSCTGEYKVYDSTGVNLKWNITYLEDNLVNISVSGVVAQPRVIFTDTCALAAQYSFPESLRGIVGGEVMVVERAYYPSDTSGLAYYQLGKFYYTANSMSGDLSFLLCDTVHCRGYTTRANAVVLRKQN